MINAEIAHNGYCARCGCGDWNPLRQVVCPKCYERREVKRKAKFAKLAKHFMGSIASNLN